MEMSGSKMKRKLKAIWWILLGRPVMYRVKVVSEFRLSGRNKNALLIENEFFSAEVDEALATVEREG